MIKGINGTAVSIPGSLSEGLRESPSEQDNSGNHVLPNWRSMADLRISKATGLPWGQVRTTAP